MKEFQQQAKIKAAEEAARIAAEEAAAQKAYEEEAARVKAEAEAQIEAQQEAARVKAEEDAKSAEAPMSLLFVSSHGNSTMLSVTDRVRQVLIAREVPFEEVDLCDPMTGMGVREARDRMEAL